MKKTIITALCALLLTAGLPAAAYAQELVVGGQAVGIQIRTEGVMVAGVSEVETAKGCVSPAGDAGLHEGDFILEINGEKVESAGGLVESVGELRGAPAKLKIHRGDKTLELTVQPVLSDENQWLMGMWLRDGISGIGTVTFRDPETGTYGALGHSISDADTGVMIPLDEGNISEAEIVGITKGTAGCHGELNGCADVGKVLGNVDKNTEYGIFGQTHIPMGDRIIETGEMCTGCASIICTVKGRTCKEFSVEINRIYNDTSGQHALITVTDPKLLAETGGIVQGMSGSPIIQNGKLVGAVTHVFVNDPSRGYGVGIKDMLRSAGLEAEKKAA